MAKLLDDLVHKKGHGFDKWNLENGAEVDQIGTLIENLYGLGKIII